MYALSDGVIPPPLRAVFRGLGQVFFQENALTGICFALGLAVSSPLMATRRGDPGDDWHGDGLGGIKFDKAEQDAGIYGFNSAAGWDRHVFFFQPSVGSTTL